jgi:hypothetical protein
MVLASPDVTVVSFVLLSSVDPPIGDVQTVADYSNTSEVPAVLASLLHVLAPLLLLFSSLLLLMFPLLLAILPFLLSNMLEYQAFGR